MIGTRKICAGVLVALGTTGCAETAPPAPSVPLVVFPTRAEVAAIPAEKPRAEAFGEVETDARPWTVHVEAKGERAPYEDASAWGDFLRAAVNKHAQSVSLSPSLKCASEELAKVARRSQRLPPPKITRFIVARCGAVLTSSRTLVWSAEATADVTDAQLVESAKAKLAPALETLLVHADEQARAGGRHFTVGLGVVRDDKGASVVIKVGESDATVDATPLRADAKHLVTIRGEVHGTYASLEALVNAGPSGFARCRPEGAVALPHFAFTCRLADKDPYAWVTLLGKQPGLALSRIVATGIVAGKDDAPVVFTSTAGAAPALVNTPTELQAAFLDGVNRARAAANLAPLALDAKQSAENTRLTGTLINATLASAPKESSDRAALGLLAGWDVTGTIRSGQILVGAVGPTRDATVLLDWTLESPVGRATLLDPASRLIAIGAAVPEDGSAIGAAVTTYSLFDSDDPRRDDSLVYKRIDQARAAHRLAPARFLTGFPEMQEHAARVLADGANPRAELQAMLAVASARSGEATRGAVIEATDLDHLALPDIATRSGDVRIAVAVTHHRAPGAAWGQYVVFFVTVGEDAPQPH